MSLQHLLLPLRETRSGELLSSVCFWSGVTASRLDPDMPDSLPAGCNSENSAIHGGPGFCRKVAALLGVTVAEPTDDFLLHLPLEFVSRHIELMSLKEARLVRSPRFIKPVNDKYFPAGVYASGAGLEVKEKFDHESVLVSEPVEWECEFRLFILDRQIKASSPYLPKETTIRPELYSQARVFGERVLKETKIELPRAVVIDVGFIQGRGWAVVEANAATMCSLYDCDPAAVLEVLRYGLR